MTSRSFCAQGRWERGLGLSARMPQASDLMTCVALELRGRQGEELKPKPVAEIFFGTRFGLEIKGSGFRPEFLLKSGGALLHSPIEGNLKANYHQKTLCACSRSKLQLQHVPC